MISKWDMLENLVDVLCLEYPQWRLGQAHFNALAFLDPETTNQIRGTNDDCFYQDKKIPLFQNKVLEIWGE